MVVHVVVQINRFVNGQHSLRLVEQTQLFQSKCMVMKVKGSFTVNQMYI